MRKVLSILPIITFILVCFLAYIGYINISKIKIELNDNNIVDIYSTHKVREFVKNVKNGKLTNGDKEITFEQLGEEKVTAKFIDKFNKKHKGIIIVKVIDKENPTISFKEKISITEGDKIDLLKYVKVEDNSKENITPEVIGEYDVNKVGTYNLRYKATDSSNNTSEVMFKLLVKAKPKETTKKTSKKKYYIKYNKTLNVVMVYGLDSENNYTKLIKNFVASGGDETPLGIFKTDAKAETLSLVGGVWGHYTVRFMKSRGMWFHSVPYFTKPSVGADGKKHWDNLEYEEYNKLGSLASKGCIRLAVIDAKWIYDNISNGTTVEIYESDVLPEGVVKPTPIKIDENSSNKGWDPTDPDPTNPWKLG